MKKVLSESTLVVLASTYPRWPNDKVPNFVENFVRWQLGAFKGIRVIVPHYRGAAHKENPQPKLSITRFRYMIPPSLEDIAYGEFEKASLYPLKAILYIISELLNTVRAALFSRPVIINAHWLIPQGFVAVLLKPLLRCRVIISVHGADVFTMNGTMMRKLKRYTLMRADVVVCNSSTTKEVCMGLYDKDYPIIPMGIDTKRFRPADTPVHNQTLQALFVGRVVEEKGILYVCEAIAELKRRGTDVRLTVVGDGSAKKQVEQFVIEHHLGALIDTVGWVQQEDLVGYYHRADVFVGPSVEHMNGWKEAFGLVFAEASASGLPVITTGSGGIRDIIEDEVNGLIVPERDFVAIADALERLASDRSYCRDLGKRGAEHTTKQFSWETITTKYQQIFEGSTNS